MATTCLQTKIRNTSGAEKSFSFIPPHGRRLTAGEEVSIDGDIWDKLKTKRALDALKAAIDRGDIVLVESPFERHYDATLDKVSVISIDNDTVAAADPCEGAWSSSIGS
jgi:hypothetical protein